MTEEDVRAIIKDELANLIKNDRYVFDQNIQILDSRNIQLGRANGTLIGTATDQKIGLWGKTPVVQQEAISDPVGGGTAGVDAPARAAIESILGALRNIGIIST